MSEWPTKVRLSANDERTVNRAALAILVVGVVLGVIAYLTPRSAVHRDLLRAAAITGHFAIACVVLRSALSHYLARKRSGLSRARYLLRHFKSIDKLRKQVRTLRLLAAIFALLPLILPTAVALSTGRSIAAVARGFVLFGLFFLPGAAYAFFVAQECASLIKQLSKSNEAGI